MENVDSVIEISSQSSDPEITQTLPSQEESQKSNQNQVDETDKRGALADDDEQESDSDGSLHDADSDNDENPVMMGGEIDTPAFALLAGRIEDDDTKLSIPLTRLPATLGRSHDTNDKHFFGVGNRKALSRQQCVISFQNSVGATLGQFDAKSDKLSYREEKQVGKVICKNDQDLKPEGFFVIKCLGKNKIFVHGQRVEQGQVALLQHGTPIRMNAVCIYFLLPSNSKESTMEVPIPGHAVVNKRKTPPSSTASPPKKKKPAPAKTSSFAAELEALSIETLLSRMTEAVESNQWDRKHQMIGCAISLHAVKDAARAKLIRDQQHDKGGVARSDIMAWIKENPKYTSWVSQMLGKMELKSLQSNVSKALVKAGYVRTGTTGRHVKWILPESEQSQEEESSSKEEEEEEEESSEGDDKSEGSNVKNETAGNNSDHSSGEGSESEDDERDLDEEQIPADPHHPMV